MSDEKPVNDYDLFLLGYISLEEYHRRVLSFNEMISGMPKLMIPSFSREFIQESRRQALYVIKGGKE